MGAMSDVAIDLLEQYGDIVDIYLKVPASYEMAVGFLKKKLPQLTDEQLHFLINEITSAYHDSI